MSQGNNPYQSPTAASPAVGNTWPRLVGIALYPVAALTGLVAISTFLVLAFMLAEGGMALLLDSPPPVVLLLMPFVTVGLVWLARHLRRTRVPKSKVPD